MPVYVVQNPSHSIKWLLPIATLPKVPSSQHPALMLMGSHGFSPPLLTGERMVHHVFGFIEREKGYN